MFVFGFALCFFVFACVPEATLDELYELFLKQTNTPVVAVTDSVDDSANADAEAPELSPPPAIGPDGVPIEAKPSNTVESEKLQNVIGPNSVPIEAKPSNTVESEKQ